MAELLQRVEAFRQQPISPERTQQFEQHVQEDLRELGRQVVHRTFNQLEPAAVQSLNGLRRCMGALSDVWH